MSFANAGSIGIASGGTLALGGMVGLSGLGAIGDAGVLRISGTLDLGGGTLDASGGTLAELSVAGTLAHGTLVLDGGALDVPDGSFAGITVVGTLALGQGQLLRVSGGLAVRNTAGAATGTIDLRGGGALNFLDSETLDAAKVLVGGNAALTQSPSAATLTIGAATTIAGVSGAVSLSTSYQRSTLVNAGTITLAGGALSTYAAGSIDNSGLIVLGPGESWSAYGTGTLANTGSLSVEADAALHAGANVFINTGLVSIAAGGTLDLAGATLDLQAGTALGGVMVAGTIENGTVIDDGGHVTLLGSGLAVNIKTTTGTGAGTSFAPITQATISDMEGRATFVSDTLVATPNVDASRVDASLVAVPPLPVPSLDMIGVMDDTSLAAYPMSAQPTPSPIPMVFAGTHAQ